MEQKNKKLYLVSTTAFSTYVIAETPNQAQETLERWLQEQNYGFIKDRDVIEIKLLAKEGISPNSQLNATSQLLFWEPPYEEYPLVAKMKGEQ